MRRRMILAFVSSVALFGVAPPALSAPEASVIERFVDTEVRALENHTLVIQKIVDRHGRVLTSSTRTTENPRMRTFGGLPFACGHEGHRAGFQQQPVREAFEQGKNDLIHFQFFSYSMDRARDNVAGFPTQQWLVCATGGADGNNGSRTVISGPGIAYQDRDATHKIGQVWKEGKTPANYTVSLGFEVGRGPVKVNGGIQQTPHHSLKGSPRPPIDSDMDAFSRNGVNGWWEHACVPRCVGSSGSGDFQGSVAEGLWEFPQGKRVHVDAFAMSGFTRHFCANPFGC